MKPLWTKRRSLRGKTLYLSAPPMAGPVGNELCAALLDATCDGCGYRVCACRARDPQGAEPDSVTIDEAATQPEPWEGARKAEALGMRCYVTTTPSGKAAWVADHADVRVRSHDGGVSWRVGPFKMGDWGVEPGDAQTFFSLDAALARVRKLVAEQEEPEPAPPPLPAGWTANGTWRFRHEKWRLQVWQLHGRWRIDRGGELAFPNDMHMPGPFDTHIGAIDAAVKLYLGMAGART